MKPNASPNSAPAAGPVPSEASSASANREPSQAVKALVEARRKAEQSFRNPTSEGSDDLSNINPDNNSKVNFLLVDPKPDDSVLNPKGANDVSGINNDNAEKGGASANSGEADKGIDDIAKALGSKTLDILAIDTEGERGRTLFMKDKYGKNMEEMARQAARERIEKEKKAVTAFGDGLTGFVKWFQYKAPVVGALVETYKFNKYREESLKVQAETGKIYAGLNDAEIENVDGKKVVKNAGDLDILRRFEDAKALESEVAETEGEEAAKGISKQIISSHAGEKLETKNDDPVAKEVKAELAKLAREIAAGNSEEQRKQAKEAFDKKVQQWEEEKFLVGSNTSVNNLQEIGDKVYDKMNGHKFSTQAIDEYFDKKVNMNFGQANVGLRQTEKLDGNAKLAAKFGLAGLAIGTVWKGGVRAVFGLGGLVMAPIYAGIRADTKAKQEQIKTEKSKTLDENSKDRLNAERAAEDLKSFFEEGTNKLRGDLTEEQKDEFMSLVALARAKQTVSDDKNFDMFSYKDMQSVEKARTDLSMQLARSMVAINRDESLNKDFKDRYDKVREQVTAEIENTLDTYKKDRYKKILKGAAVGFAAALGANFLRGAIDVASDGTGGDFLQRLGAAKDNILSGKVALNGETFHKIGFKTIDNIQADWQKFTNGGLVGKGIRSVSANAAVSANSISGNSISGNSVSGNGLGSQMVAAGQETGAIGTGGQKSEAFLFFDKDGGKALFMNGKNIIGEGDDSGIAWEKDGKLSDDSINRINEALKANGIGEIEKHVEHVPVKTESSHTLGEAFFASHRKEIDNFYNNSTPTERAGMLKPLFEKIGNRTWDADNNISIGNPRIDGDEILIPVNGSDANGTEVLFTMPGADDMGASLPVESDGFVHISMNSADLDLSTHEGQVEAMTASMFNVDKSSNEVVFSGWKMEVGHNDDAGGGFEVMRTVFGSKDLAQVSTFEDGIHEVTSYGIPMEGEKSDATKGVEIIDGKPMFMLNPENTATYNELEDRGVDMSLYDVDRVSMTARTGESIGVRIGGNDMGFDTVEHANGYTVENDPWAIPADRESLGVAYGEANTGVDISERAQNIIDGWTKSPEQLAQVRVMLGLGNESGYGSSSLLYHDDSLLTLYPGSDGSIDSLDELNAYAEYIRDLDPDEYDKLVKQTLGLFYDRLQGGSIDELDYSVNRYDLTSYMKNDSTKEGWNPVSFFSRKRSATNGTGTIFKDANGKNIFDSAEIRKIWGVKSNATKFEVSFRHQCGNQVVSDVDYPAPKPKPVVAPTPQPQPQPVVTIINQETGVEQTGSENEGTGTEYENVTGDEGTGHEGTGHEGTGHEGTGNEGTGDEGTGDEDTGTEYEGKGPDAHSGGSETIIDSPEDGHGDLQPDQEYVPSEPGGNSPQGDAPISSDGDGSASSGGGGDSSLANPESAGGNNPVQSGDDAADSIADRVNQHNGEPDHSYDGGGGGHSEPEHHEPEHHEPEHHEPEHHEEHHEPEHHEEHHEHEDSGSGE